MQNYPTLKIKVLDKTSCINSIAQFFLTESRPYGWFQKFIAENLSLDLDKLNKIKTNEEIFDFCYSKFDKFYEAILPEMEQSKTNLIKYFDIYKKEIFLTLNKIFDVSFAGKNFLAGIMFNPVCPRYLETLLFEINYKMSVQEQLNIIIHELIHFYFFKRLKLEFPEFSIEDFDSPNLPWLFSEIAIDAIFKCTPLNKFLTNQQPAYIYFYDKKFNGQNLMKIFENLFQENNILDYMKKSLKFINDNAEYFKKLVY